MNTEQDFVSTVDKSLKFVRDLKPYFDGRRVYHVADGSGGDYVLKAFDIHLEDARSCFRRELSALSRARDVRGITHLVRSFGVVGGFEVILREYHPGEDLFVLRKPLRRRVLREQAEGAIRHLHGLGIVVRDVSPSNLVLSPDLGEVKIVDLDRCAFNDAVSPGELETLKHRDYRELKHLYS